MIKAFSPRHTRGTATLTPCPTTPPPVLAHADDQRWFIPNTAPGGGGGATRRANSTKPLHGCWCRVGGRAATGLLLVSAVGCGHRSIWSLPLWSQGVTKAAKGQGTHKGRNTARKTRAKAHTARGKQRLRGRAGDRGTTQQHTPTLHERERSARTTHKENGVRGI